MDGTPPALAGRSDGRALRIETVTNVEPLDAQIGTDPKKTVPDALADVLFAGPAATYAILDAAKVPGLPEMLEDSGLEYRCLFTGKALEDLADVAPWQLWDKEPGIFVRSEAGLEQVWRHFRKFTRIQGESGKWFYFRFWDAGLLHHMLQARTSKGILGILADDVDVQGWAMGQGWLRIAGQGALPRDKIERRLQEEHFIALRRFRYANYARTLLAWLQDLSAGPSGGLNAEDFVHREIGRAQICLKTQDTELISTYVAAAWLSGQSFETRINAMVATGLPPADAAKALYYQAYSELGDRT